MTSKEALDYFVALCTLNFDKKGAKRVSVIKKDLEILEILKNESDNKKIIERNGIASFHLDMILTTDTYEKIKEWLNGNN